MGVAHYETEKGRRWKVDEWLTTPDGELIRFRKRMIPTREMAEALVAKKRAEAFEGRHFDRQKTPQLTVEDVWKVFETAKKEKYDSWQTDAGRAGHLLRHLGARRATALTEHDIEAYRDKRLAETTQRGKAPMPATLDREVELLRRMLNYAVRIKKLATNPLVGVKLLREPNVRRVVIGEEAFDRLFMAAEGWLQPIILVAFDTGMREREILDLRWEQVDLGEGCIRLAPQDTKTEEARAVYLTTRVARVLERLKKRATTKYVFPNEATGEPWQDLRKSFHTALAATGLTGTWFHDLRRSFVTNARRHGVPESVVMRMSGHKTRAVFDRYNIVSDDDVKAAVGRIEAARLGQEMDKVKKSAPQNAESPPDSGGLSGA